MIAVKVKTEDTTKRVADAAMKAAFKNFRHAAASISRDVKQNLEKAEGPSEPGDEPHTHKGIYLRRAIRWDGDKDGAIIGPAASAVDQVGELHEFGGEREGAQYPARPFMAPALEKAIPRLAGDWAGTIGE